MTAFYTDAEKFQTLADFSKAAYAVQSWENSGINDFSAGADASLSRLLTGGWQPLEFDISPTYRAYSSSSARFTTLDKMEGGFYTYANAAALVARSDDSLVASFRGTNDSEDKNPNRNPNDPGDSFHPDKDHWDTLESIFSSDSMTRHYGYFSRLFTELDNYLSQHNEINSVYLTGHSMGGSMAINYMSQHPQSRLDYQLESVVFAAAPFVEKRVLGVAYREDYSDDSRITQIEISRDPVIESWEVGLNHNRPGEVIRFYGDQTLDNPDYQFPYYHFRDDNHAMDYYQELMYAVDKSAWPEIINKASTAYETGVYLGAEQIGSDYIVASEDDYLNGNSTEYNVIYGGAGEDRLVAQAYKLIDGGTGIDTLVLSGSLDRFAFDLSEMQDTSTLTTGLSQYSFRNVERLEFDDVNVAVDLNGNAGTAVRLISAIVGQGALQNPDTVGDWLAWVDSGMTPDELMAQSYASAGLQSDTDIIRTLYFNLTDEMLGSDELQTYQGMLDDGMTIYDLGWYATEHRLNQYNVELLGLSDTGIEFA